MFEKRIVFVFRERWSRDQSMRKLKKGLFLEDLQLRPLGDLPLMNIQTSRWEKRVMASYQVLLLVLLAVACSLFAVSFGWCTQSNSSSCSFEIQVCCNNECFFWFWLPRSVLLRGFRLRCLWKLLWESMQIWLSGIFIFYRIRPWII